MSGLDAKSLEGLLRARAKAALQKEAEGAVAAMTRVLGPHSTDERLRIETAARGDNVVPIIEPKEDGRHVLVVNLRYLAPLIVAKIVADNEQARGDAEVAEFMARAEQLADEINELRSEVRSHE